MQRVISLSRMRSYCSGDLGRWVSASEFHVSLNVTSSCSGRMPVVRASRAILRRSAVTSGAGPSGRFSCSVRALRNSWIVVSENALTKARANEFATLGLERQGWTFVPKYLGWVTRTLGKAWLTSQPPARRTLAGCWRSNVQIQRRLILANFRVLLLVRPTPARDSVGVLLGFLEVPLVELVCVLVVIPELLIGGYRILLMLPVRFHSILRLV